MKYGKIQSALLALAVSLSMTGCAGNDSDGRRSRTASRGRFSIGKNKNADAARANRRRGAGDINDFSPEGSMERDLSRLREREKAQEKMLKDMRGNLDQRSDNVRREEEKLAEIRRRIHNYDTAIERYGMAAKSRPPRENAGEPSVVPREMFEERGVGASAVAYSGDDYYAPENPYASIPRRESRLLHSAETTSAYGNAPVREYRSDLSAAPSGRADYASYGHEAMPQTEQVIYAAPAPVVNGARAAASPGSLPPVMQKAASDRNAKPFAGAPVGRSNNASRQAVESRAALEDDYSVPANLYSKNAAPSMVAQYSGLSNRQSEEDMRLDQAIRDREAAAGKSQYSAMAAPAAADRASPPRTEVKLPIRPQPAPQQPAAAAPAPAFEDEVFTPDLFLSGS